MARAKRKSSILETGRQRLAGLSSISPAPDFGAGLKLSDYDADLKALSDKLDSYNTQLASLDQTQNELEAMEASLRDKNARFLSASEARYGSDSSEYEQAGGTRRSERKKPVRKNKGGPTP